MAEEKPVASIFKDTTDSMLQFFRGWEQDLPHQGEKGGIRERRVVDFLPKYLPKKYGIGTGHIVDSNGNFSSQIDIVIYDAVNGTALPIDSYYSVFPAECVYATVEVKSKLTASDSLDENNRGEIYTCMKSATKSKSLHRIGGLPNILSLVFAYTTQWTQDQWTQVASRSYYFRGCYNQSLPEVILVLDPGFVLCWYKLEGQEDKKYYSHFVTKNPLLFFLSDLITRLSKQKIHSPDLWQSYGDWLSTDKILTIIQAEFYSAVDAKIVAFKEANKHLVG
jgi:hypothetical protein